LHITIAFQAELHGLMNAIKIASKKSWSRLWLEIDSKLVILAFKTFSIFPWHLRNRWMNCMKITKDMEIFISHIFREDDHCAGKIASIGF
jgi:ribonuclease HI